MPSNDYHFITRWRVEGRVEEVAEILADSEALAAWWPSAYPEVHELEPGDDSGVGKLVSLQTRGWLPYTLRWQFRVTESNYPHGFKLDAWGDLDGQGIWTLKQDGLWVSATYDWRVRADKPLLRYFSSLFRPIFAANHSWVMNQGERSLRLELARRRAASPEDRALIPAPPRPALTSPAAMGIAGAAVIAALGYWLLTARRRSQRAQR